MIADRDALKRAALEAFDCPESGNDAATVAYRLRVDHDLRVDPTTLADIGRALVEARHLTEGTLRALEVDEDLCREKGPAGVLEDRLLYVEEVLTAARRHRPRVPADLAALREVAALAQRRALEAQRAHDEAALLPPWQSDAPRARAAARLAYSRALDDSSAALAELRLAVARG